MHGDNNLCYYDFILILVASDSGYEQNQKSSILVKILDLMTTSTNILVA